MLSLIPISDANPTRRFPAVTLLLIAANVAVFFFVQPGLGQNLEASFYFVENAPIPCQLEESCPDGLQLATDIRPVPIPERTITSFLGAALFSTFMHAGWLHIIGNMLFLWVFGNNIEDFLGPVKFLAFYLLGGIFASFAHAWTHLDSFLPSVGASGAVAAVMGAYLVLYPRARVNVLVMVVFFLTVIQMSALLVLGLWFLYQFLYAYQEASLATDVAWMAHVGGFLFGLFGIFLLGGRPHRPPPEWVGGWRDR